jgi:Carboxypeptidase regulatory-like domain
MALIRGRVVDAEGRPVPHAVLHFVSAPTFRPDIGQLTDDDGQFVFAVPPGSYILGVWADTAGSGETAFEVRGEEDMPLAITISRS